MVHRRHHQLSDPRYLGGVQYPWDSWRTLLPLVVGVVGFAGFIVYENYVPPEPTFRLHLLRSYNMAYSLYATLINAMIVLV
jgi:hypothetical protein